MKTPLKVNSVFCFRTILKICCLQEYCCSNYRKKTDIWKQLYVSKIWLNCFMTVLIINISKSFWIRVFSSYKMISVNGVKNTKTLYYKKKKKTLYLILNLYIHNFFKKSLQINNYTKLKIVCNKPKWNVKNWFYLHNFNFK